MRSLACFAVFWIYPTLVLKTVQLILWFKPYPQPHAWRSRCPACDLLPLDKGYTLLELLIGVSLGSLILAALGGALLVSQIRVSSGIQRTMESRDSVNRAIDMIRREVMYSSRLISVPSVAASLNPLVDCDEPNTTFKMVRASEIVCYKSLRTSALPPVYQNIVSGPCALVRVGPGYKPNGDLIVSSDLDVSSMPIAQVVLDGLKVSQLGSCRTALLATPVNIDNPASNSIPVVRNLDLELKMANGAVYAFAAKVSSSPAYGGVDLYAVSKCDVSAGCEINNPGATSMHYKPVMSGANELINGSDDRDNIFYFSYPYAEYSLSVGSPGGSRCTYASCYVSRGSAGVLMTNVDSLVFSDQEIRPGV